MQANQIPAKFPIPWANAAGGGYIRPIPTASQIGITNGAASLTDGFVPVNFQPVGSGGIPPAGQDFNGILNQITAWARWQAAGGTVPFDATFAAAISGYPYGAIIQSTTSGKLWMNVADGNTTNPDSGSAANWVSVGNGLTLLTKGRLTGAGTLTLPTGAKRLFSRSVAGGAAGGSGTTSTTANGNGGGGGGAAEAWTDVSAVTTVPFTCGAGASATTGSGNTGGNGGTTTFGPSGSPYSQATGGIGGGGYNGGYTSGPIPGSAGVGTVGDFLFPGNPGQPGTGGNQAGIGGGSPWGGGGMCGFLANSSTGSPVIVASPGTFGGGGGGGNAGTAGATQNAGAGGNGYIDYEVWG